MITKIADFWDVTLYSHAQGSTSDTGFLSKVQNLWTPPLSLCNYCTSKSHGNKSIGWGNKYTNISKSAANFTLQARKWDQLTFMS